MTSVLSDQDKRSIYDIYGKKGLDAGWEVSGGIFEFIMLRKGNDGL